jgi:hypothetical protein
MRFKKLVEFTILIALFIAVIGTAYVFIVTIIFNDGTFVGFFNTWHFPMLLAIFIDIAYYKHINRLKVEKTLV